MIAGWIAGLIACLIFWWLDSWLKSWLDRWLVGLIAGLIGLAPQRVWPQWGWPPITGRILFPHNRVENPKFLSQFVKGILCFCTLNNALKSNDFFRTIFGALFFKSIIDLVIGMSGHLFLCRISLLLVLSTRGYCACGELEGRWPKHIVPT